MRKMMLGGVLVVLFGGGGIAAWWMLDEDGSNGETTSETITLATFNIQNLGRDKPDQAKLAAEIIKQFDVVAVQEVMNYGGGTKGLQAVNKIVEELGDGWASIVSTEPNGTESAASGAVHTFEFYAFIYNTTKVQIVGAARLWDEAANPDSDLTDQERQFDREPFIASFKVVNGNLDFTVISHHAAAPGKSWRDDEIKRLKSVYQAVQAEDPNQNDVFLMGDFNTPVNKSEWSDLKGLATMTHILTADDKTTLNKSAGKLSQNQYDTIWCQSDASAEDIIPDSGQVVSAWRAVTEYDSNLTPPATITETDAQLLWKYGQVVSDHLPVMLVLYANKDTDGFE